MKKMLVVLMVIVMVLPTISVSAKEVATLPAFDVYFNGNKVESEYRKYPLLVYKDITYFPMTYFDSRHLGIVTEWDGETNTLAISKKNINSILTAYKGESKNQTENDVSICNFNIIVNGKAIDTKTEPYPLLTFRDVTYFPLTWLFAVDEFGWEYSFDEDAGLSINSSNHRVKMLDLSALEMNSLYDGFTCDGDYYYHHNSATGNIYRTPVDDLDNQEVIYHIESGVPAGLGFSDGKVFLSYRSGSATMGTNYSYYINKDKTLTEATKPSRNGGVSRYHAYGDGVTAELSCFTGDWSFCYYIGENKTEVEIPGISFGTPGRHFSDEVIPPQIVGDNIYVIGYKGEEEVKILYSINVKTGEILEIEDNVDNFKAYDSNNEFGQVVIYTQEGCLDQYIVDANEYREIRENSGTFIDMIQIMQEDEDYIEKSPFWGMYVITKDDKGTYVDVYGNPNGSVPPPYQGRERLMTFSANTSFSYYNGYLVARDKSENPSARLVVFHTSNEGYNSHVKTPFVSADDATALTIFGDTLIYRNVETGEFCEVNLKP
ncbi:MAG: hypothetical protein IKA17_08200 [Clostridia bacterium]|nr:hypothetical protein [Clostridia bacterium]